MFPLGACGGLGVGVGGGAFGYVGALLLSWGGRWLVGRVRVVWWCGVSGGGWLVPLCVARGGRSFVVLVLGRLVLKCAVSVTSLAILYPSSSSQLLVVMTVYGLCIRLLVMFCFSAFALSCMFASFN